MKGLLLLGLVLSSFASADEAGLDPAPNSVLPVVEQLPELSFRLLAPQGNDLAKAISNQTPVKSQGGRGVCSIFSATAMLESWIKINRKEELDLSENYMEYLVQTRVKGSPSPGSDVVWNIPAANRYGDILESDWPYEPTNWEGQISGDEQVKADKACGSTYGPQKKTCLFVHRDPQNDPDMAKASNFRSLYQTYRLQFQKIGYQNQIKQILDRGYPLVLGLEFFCGAWQHACKETYGIGKRDMVAWGKGIVSAPTTIDIEISRQHPAGHSILIVGYDDAKRVYYFKNSWGTTGFGAQVDLLGTGNTAGYGTISYDYAHNYGTFNYVY